MVENNAYAILVRIIRLTKLRWFQLELVQVCTGELGYDGPLYDGFLHMTDHMLGPSLMHIKYSSYVYDGFCI